MLRIITAFTEGFDVGWLTKIFVSVAASMGLCVVVVEYKGV